MAYDRQLAECIINTLVTINPPNLTSKKMFGGIGYMVQGNMACGVLEKRLIVRVGKEAYDQLLTQPGVSVFDTSGRSMAGWIMVDASALSDEADLTRWVSTGVNVALSLPAK